MSDAARDADVGEVRDEDRFDAVAVDAWLRTNVDAFAAGAGPPRVQQFSKGASNLTYLLEYPNDSLILRRAPSGAKVAAAHDMGREFRVQRALRPTFPSVPRMVAYCADESVIGGEFYVMERIAGTILRRSLPPELELTPEAVGALCRSFIDNLVTLHHVDATQPGLAEIGRGDGYVERQVSGWSKRYRAARTWNAPSFDHVMGWLQANQPPDVATCVIHNDYRLDNVVLAPDDPSRIVGVLDWEMATLGDPLMDLGGAMAYWTEPGDGAAMQWMRRQPTTAPGMLTRKEVVAYYGERSGLSTEHWRFYEVFGLFRLAVIIQQIYRRYQLGQTTNPAFKRYWIAVNYFDVRCRRLIRSS